MKPLPLLALALFLVLLSPLTEVMAQGKITYKNRCPHCKTTGKIPNPFWDKYPALDERILFDSHSMEKDTAALAMPFIPCERCRNDTLKALAVADFEKGLAERRKWLEDRRKKDQAIKAPEPLFHLETEHFVWGWDIPKINWKKKTYRNQDALRLFAGLMEDFYAKYQAVHGINDSQNYNNKHYLYCFERQLVSRRACLEFVKKAVPGGKTYQSVKPSIFVTWWDKGKMPSIEDFHRDLIHIGVHLFTANWRTPYWFYKAGFAYEGLAHWWEIYYYKRATSHCFWELLSLSDWISTKWESKVKKAVVASKQPALSSMLDSDGGSLAAEHHVFAWSYMDYMMHMDPFKTQEFCDVLTQKRPVRDAFREAWGMSILGFEEKWIEYVKEKYSAQEDDIPMIRRRR